MSYKDKDKQKEYQKEWLMERRKIFFSGKKCSLCDATNFLQLHHPDRDQKKDHKIWSWSEKRRDMELSKCVILCKKCHIELHAKELRIHGTVSRYQAGCRCDLCRKKMVITSKKWYENRKRKKLLLASRVEERLLDSLISY